MFEHLTAPGRIGRMRLRSHVIMGPTETHFASTDGMVTQPDIDYYARRARGGAALIVSHQIQCNTKIDPIDPYPRSARLDDNAYIPMMCELTEAVHLEGAKIAALLTPGGGAQALGVPYDAGSQGVYDIPNVAPGSVPCPVAGKKIRKLTVEEIHKTVEVFGLAAGRAKTAGFDAIYLHAHCGYLIAEFLSPYFNDREDEYGGSLENRARFLLELIASCRRNVGEDFPLVVRLAADEFIGSAGRELPETVELAKMLEKAGVDAIDCGAGLFMTMPLICPTIYHEKGCFVSLAEALKQAVGIPVIVQGRLQDPEIAEKVLAEGRADFVSLSRAWIADPDWGNKVREGHPEEIRRCISCNHCIGDRICGNLTLRCTLNAEAGRESRFGGGLPAAGERKTVAVIGAGPAGLEAAYRCVQRGYTVELFEKSSAICGGEQISAAMAPPRKEILGNIARFYRAQFAGMPGIHLHLNTAVTEETLRTLRADAVILATGGEPMIPKIPGLESLPGVVTANDVLREKASVKGSVLIAGGGQVGVETAHFLRERGHEVTIVEMQPALSMDGELMTNLTLLPMLEAQGVKRYVGHRILRVEEHSAVIEELASGERKELPFDTLVLALGRKPVNALEKAARERFPECLVIGDAETTASIGRAIESGFFAALKV